MSTCDGCGRPIVWLVMRKTGKRMPADPTKRLFIQGDGPDQAICAATLESVRGRYVPADQPVSAANAIVVYTAHWATCPERDRFRRSPARPSVRAAAHLRNPYHGQ
jgi:hypothetical protein